MRAKFITVRRGPNRTIVLVEVGKLFGPHFFVVMRLKVRHGRDAGGVDPMNVARVERTIEDMGFNVVLMEQRVGKSRAEASCPHDATDRPSPPGCGDL